MRPPDTAGHEQSFAKEHGVARASQRNMTWHEQSFRLEGQMRLTARPWLPRAQQARR